MEKLPQMSKPVAISAYIARWEGNEPRYLLMRRSSYYLHGIWQGVSGGIEAGEFAAEAALREIREETGLTPVKLYSADTVEVFYQPSEDAVQLIPVFVAMAPEPCEVRLAPAEHDDYAWLRLDEALLRLEFAEQRRTLKAIDECFFQRQPSEHLLLAGRTAHRHKLETERLVIRSFQDEDITEFASLVADPEVMRFSRRGIQGSHEAHRSLSLFIQRERDFRISLLAVCLKSTNQLIGMCGIYWEKIDGKIVPELGFRLAPAFWGAGLAFEAATNVKRYAEERLGLTGLVSFVSPDNHRSIRLIQRLGGEFHKESLPHGIHCHIYRYPLANS